MLDIVDPAKVWRIETKTPSTETNLGESDIYTDEILIGLPKKVMTSLRQEGGRVHHKGAYINGRRLSWEFCEVRKGIMSSQTRTLIFSVEVDKKGNLVLEEKQVQLGGIEVTYRVFAERK